MIDTDEYERTTPELEEFEGETLGDTLTNLLAEVLRLSEIEQEWLMMWATLEELYLVADVRKNMTEHGFTFPTDEDVIE